MINDSRLGYELKRDLANFSEKIFDKVKRPQKNWLPNDLWNLRRK